MIKTLPSTNFTLVTWRKSSSLLEVSSPVRRHVHLAMFVSYWVLNLTSIKTTKIVIHRQKIKANENEGRISYHVATPRSEHYDFPMKSLGELRKCGLAAKSSYLEQSRYLAGRRIQRRGFI